MRRNNGHLVPVAIELWHLDGSGPDGKTTVYTPANSLANASCPRLPERVALRPAAFDVLERLRTAL